MKRNIYIKPSILVVETEAEALMAGSFKTDNNNFTGDGKDEGPGYAGTIVDDEETTTSNAPRRSIWD